MAKLANLSKKELAKYENSLKVYRDLKGVIDTSFEEGLERGIERGIEQEKLNVVKTALQEGLPITIISKLTGLSQEKIENIK